MAVPLIRDDRGQLDDALAPLLGDEPEFRQMRTQRVDQLCALADQQVSRSMQHQSRLLFCRLDRHEPHRWTRHGFANGSGIGGIALGALDVALHVAWRHHPDGMAEPRQLARPIMRRATGLHADQAGRDLAEKLDDLFAPQLPGNDDLPVLVDAVDLKDILGEINADGANLHVDDPLR